MHLIATEIGMMGTSAVVGTTIANAIGHAYGLKYRKERALVVSFFGDGATEEGVFAESLNFAALKQLPILFVCENNRYAIHTHQNRRQATDAICKRAEAIGVPAERIEHGDMLYLHQRVKAVAPGIRAGQGPYFFEVMTYRWGEHVGPNSDFKLGYRSEQEAEPWHQTDQVKRLAALVEARQAASIRDEVEAEVAEAFAFAEGSPEPVPAQLFSDVFKERNS
jgi:TPP-dependent pyruvate/acetoin dehydrogenase alpha subunit